MAEWTQTYLLVLSVLAAQDRTTPIGTVALILGTLVYSLDPTSTTN